MGEEHEEGWTEHTALWRTCAQDGSCVVIHSDILWSVGEKVHKHGEMDNPSLLGDYG